MADRLLFPYVLSLTQKNKPAPYPLRDLDEHLDAALHWIEQASRAVGGAGISKGYDLLRSRWFPAYPETTGYTLPTLINASRLLGNDAWRELAIGHAEYLLNCVTEDGGVLYWKKSRKANPIVFDTGQVILGWLAVFRDTGAENFLRAAMRSGDWLVKVQEPDGIWKEHQYRRVYKVIDARVDWALLVLFQATGETRYRDAAVRNLEWVLAQQTSDGWFQNCGVVPNQVPVTHYLAYAAEGLYLSGDLLKEPRYLQAGKKTADRLLDLQRSDGYLAGAFSADWKETEASCCLTGDLQMSILWMLLWVKSGTPEYHEAARRGLEFVCRTQFLDTPDLNIRGSIGGSFPLYGKYERYKLPEWAAKFLISAILWVKALEGDRLPELLPG
ncbi:prenyltransferase-like [Longilinea arvoryzae]|uniref:Prenyltransferase-like n=1 Tax=Longilinea arvoryzae TaxID=360412 RepID=A0A0S7BI52_9CHLR|nr:prenyltransferase/squalene oxidase repeat-containing protein [Longilinea arvoryzae]GAP13477.1 prenyltransferase-like [Longilinea arvoryzae]